MNTTKPTEVSFWFNLSEFSAVGSSFSKDREFTRSFTASGICSNGETDGKGRFNGRKARVMIAAPASKGVAEECAEKHGIKDACGHIVIRKDVQPKRYDLEDGEAFDPPIEIYFTVDHDMLDRLFETVRGTIEAHRFLSLSLTAASTLFPASSFALMLVDHLDVSADQWYPVTQFNLTQQIVRLRDKADFLPRRPSWGHSKDDAYFSSRLTEVQAQQHSDRGRFCGARMSGTVRHPATIRRSSLTSKSKNTRWIRSRWTIRRKRFRALSISIRSTTATSA